MTNTNILAKNKTGTNEFARNMTKNKAKTKIRKTNPKPTLNPNPTRPRGPEGL